MSLTGLLMTIILVLVLVLVSRNMRQTVEEEMRKRGLALAQLFGGTNLTFLMTYRFEEIQKHAQIAKTENSLSYVVVYNKEGLVAANTEDLSTLQERSRDVEALGFLKLRAPQFRKMEARRSPLHQEAAADIYEVLLPLFAVESPTLWGVTRLGISSSSLDQTLRETQAHILQIGVICLALGLVGSALLAARITTPLTKLNEGSLRAAGGDLSSRIEVNSGDELESLAHNFNFMMDQIRQHHEERVRTEKMAAVGTMVNTIVHDCRTPITVIKGFASLLTEFNLSPEKQTECLYYIQFEVERMERMLEEILQFSFDKKTRLSLREEVLDNFAEECCTEIRVLLHHSEVLFQSTLNCPALVMIDKDKMRRAILNIAANAREALQGSGTLSFTTTLAAAQAVLEITDSGPGIPPEIQNKIFDPFFTHGKSMGFGLGMSITRQIVEGHSGSVKLHSIPGKGTSFFIEIPLAHKQAADAAAAHL